MDHMGEHIKMGPTCPGQLAPQESKGSCWTGGESRGTVQSWCTQVTVPAARSKFIPHFFPRALPGPAPVVAMGYGDADGFSFMPGSCRGMQRGVRVEGLEIGQRAALEWRWFMPQE